VSANVAAGEWELSPTEVTEIEGVVEAAGT
jgi:hypothetical protein